jgi:hypothetical protein
MLNARPLQTVDSFLTALATLKLINNHLTLNNAATNKRAAASSTVARRRRENVPLGGFAVGSILSSSIKDHNH